MPRPANAIGSLAIHALVAGMVAAAMLSVFALAPTEQTMGDVQRILYIHVATAWCGLAAFLLMAACGAMFLLRRDLAWDDWAQAAAELGWLACGMTLATGSLWARAAWNAWWTWDPRLTATLVLWMIYSGTLVLRGSIDDPHRRARVGAILAILGSIDLPLVMMATRWFRGMHPAAPQMASTMRAVLLLTVVAVSAVFVLLLVRRCMQLRLKRAIADLEQDLEDGCSESLSPIFHSGEALS